MDYCHERFTSESILAFLFYDGVEENSIKLHLVWILGTYLGKKNMNDF